MIYLTLQKNVSSAKESENENILNIRRGQRRKRRNRVQKVKGMW